MGKAGPQGQHEKQRVPALRLHCIVELVYCTMMIVRRTTTAAMKRSIPSLRGAQHQKSTIGSIPSSHQSRKSQGSSFPYPHHNTIHSIAKDEKYTNPRTGFPIAMPCSLHHEASMRQKHCHYYCIIIYSTCSRRLVTRDRESMPCACPTRARLVERSVACLLVGSRVYDDDDAALARSRWGLGCGDLPSSASAFEFAAYNVSRSGSGLRRRRRLSGESQSQSRSQEVCSVLPRDGVEYLVIFLMLVLVLWIW